MGLKFLEFVPNELLLATILRKLERSKHIQQLILSLIFFFICMSQSLFILFWGLK